MTKVIHIRNKTGSSDEVYIGRGSKWGNPYPIDEHNNREDVIALYWELMDNRMKQDPIHWHEELKKLRGKTLVCYCKPKACHGDVLIELLGEDNG